MFECLCHILILTAAPPQVVPEAEASPLVKEERAEAPAPARFPIAVPLTMGRRHLGEIDIYAGMAGEKDAAVDLERLLDLLSPHLDSKIRQQLAAARTSETGFAELADIPSEAVEIRFDNGLLELQAAVTAENRSGQDISLGRQRTPVGTLATATPATFAAGTTVRSNVRYIEDEKDTNDGFAPLRASLDGFASYKGSAGVALFGGAEYDERLDDPWRFQPLYAVHDDPERAIRYEAGEILAPFRSLQGSGEILGLSIARRYERLQPQRNLSPTGRQEFLLQRPARVDFIVNSVVVQSLDLDAGRYRVSDFPLLSGENQVRVVAEDGVNRIDALDTAFIFDPDLIDPGITDFGVSIGKLANLPDDPVVASGYFRTGITAQMTLGINTQVNEEGTALAGAEGQFATPIGTLLLDAAYSEAADLKGTATFFQLRNVYSLAEEDDAVVDVNFESTTEHFTTPFRETASNPTIWRSRVNFSYRGFDAWAFQAASFYNNNRERRDEWGLSTSVGRTFWDINTSATLKYDGGRSRGDAVSFFFSLNKSFGRNWRTGASYSTVNERRELFALQSQPEALGALSYGSRYRESEQNESFRSNMRYDHNRFTSRIEHEWREERSSGLERNEFGATIETFVGIADGKAGIGRPSGTRQAFVVASRNDSLARSDVYVTDLSGKRNKAKIGSRIPTLVPVSRPYRNETLLFAAENLPLGYAVEQSDISVTASAGSGYVFEYGSDEWRSALGNFVGPDGAPVANTIARICRDGQSKTFFTNAAGRFVFENVSLGTYQVIIDGRTVGEVTLDAAKEEALINVGIQTLRVTGDGRPLDDTPVTECRAG